MEYFVLAALMLLATIAFYGQHLAGQGKGARGQIEAAHDHLVSELLKP